MKKKDLRPYKVYAIKEGTVIDHIPGRKAIKVVEVLGLNKEGADSILTMGINLTSKRHGSKDVVKIENKDLTKEELNKIAFVAPTASISLIKNYEIFEKFQVKIPKKFVNLLECTNSNCITNRENVDSLFHTTSTDPLKVKCHYCERTVVGEDVKVK